MPGPLSVTVIVMQSALPQASTWTRTPAARVAQSIVDERGECLSNPIRIHSRSKSATRLDAHGGPAFASDGGEVLRDAAHEISQIDDTRLRRQPAGFGSRDQEQVVEHTREHASLFENALEHFCVILEVRKPVRSATCVSPRMIVSGMRSS